MGEKSAITNTVLRLYSQSDVPAVMAVLKERNMDQVFKRMLSNIAPGLVRFTLPVLVVSDEIVAFPTLDFKVVPSSPIEWSVLYARDERSTKFFFPGVRQSAKLCWSSGQ